MPDKLKELYDGLVNNPAVSGLPDFDAFKTSMADKNIASSFYDRLSKTEGISGIPANFDDFSSALGLSFEDSKKKNGGEDFSSQAGSSTQNTQTTTPASASGFGDLNKIITGNFLGESYSVDYAGKQYPISRFDLPKDTRPYPARVTSTEQFHQEYIDGIQSALNNPEFQNTPENAQAQKFLQDVQIKNAWRNNPVAFTDVTDEQAKFYAKRGGIELGETIDQDYFNKVKALKEKINSETRAAHTTTRIQGRSDIEYKEFDEAGYKNDADNNAINAIYDKLTTRFTKRADPNEVTPSLVQDADTRPLLDKFMDFVGSASTPSYGAIAEAKKYIATNNAKKLDADFYTGLNNLAFTDSVKYDRLKAQIANGEPIPSNDYFSISQRGIVMREADQLEEVSVGKMSAEDFIKNQSSLSNKSTELLLGSKDILKSAIGDELGNILDEKHAYINDNKETRGIDHTVFGRYMYTDEEIQSAVPDALKRLGIDGNDKRVAEAITDIKDNEGWMIGMNGVKKGGLVRELFKGAAQPIRGTLASIEDIAKSDAEIYNDSVNQGAATYTETRPESMSHGAIGTLSDAVFGLGQFATQAGLAYVGGEFVEGAALAVGGARAAAAAEAVAGAKAGLSGLDASAAGIGADIFSSGSKIGNFLLRNKEAISTMATSYIQSYDNNIKATMAMTADDTQAKLGAMFLSGLEGASEMILPDVKIGREIITAFKKEAIPDLLKSISENVLKEGITKEGVSKVASFAKDKLVGIVKSLPKALMTTTQEVLEEEITQIGNFVTNAVLNPQQADQRDLPNELYQTAVSTAVSMAIPSFLHGGSGNASNQSMTKASLMLAAKNRVGMEDYVNTAVLKGTLTPEEAGRKMQVVNTAYKLATQLPTKSDGSKMNANEASDYVYSGTRAATLEHAINNTENLALKDRYKREMEIENRNSANILKVAPAMSGSLRSMVFGDAEKTAIVNNRTIDEINIKPGDEIALPSNEKAKIVSIDDKGVSVDFGEGKTITYKDANDFDSSITQAFFKDRKQFAEMNPSIHANAVEYSRKLLNTPNNDVGRIANDYVKANNIQAGNLDSRAITQVDAQRAKQIADAYENMKHDPNDPEVKASYNALKDETKQQWDAIQAAGYKMELWTGKGEPYQTSAQMSDDVANNKHLWVLPTENEFGSDENFDSSGNPLLEKTGILSGDKELTYNDMFRAVHDFFGHAHIGNQFGAIGEENAWRTHAQMYSPLARRAMTTETRGQNSWVNFSGVNNRANALFKEAAGRIKASKNDKGEIVNRDMYNEGVKLRKEAQLSFRFADQKIGLLPAQFEELNNADEEAQPGLGGKSELADFKKGDKVLLTDIAEKWPVMDEGLAPLMDWGKEQNVQIGFRGLRAQEGLAFYNYVTDEIYFNVNHPDFKNMTVRTAQETIAHELIHKAATYSFKNNKELGDQFNEEATKVLDFLRAQDISNLTEEQQFYAKYVLSETASPQELITYAMTNPHVASWFAGVQYSESETAAPKSIWQWMKEKILRLVSNVVKGQSVLDEASRLMDKYVNISTKTEEVTDEKSKIESDAKANGTYLKAPNGKDSNLSHENWITTRTQEFRDWFGEWENAPKNSSAASKILDENGEPLVMYHASDAVFTQFDPKKIDTVVNTRGAKGFHFTSSKDSVGRYGKNVYSAFLNVRKLKWISQERDMFNTVVTKDMDGLMYRFEIPGGTAADVVVYSPDQIRIIDTSNTERSELMNEAKRLVNNNVVQGYTGDVMKDAANNDANRFNQYLKDIAEQAHDERSNETTVSAYGKELVDIAQKLFPEGTFDAAQKFTGQEGADGKPVRIIGESAFDYAKRVKDWSDGVKAADESTAQEKRAAIINSKEERNYIKFLKEGVKLLRKDLTANDRESFNEKLGLPADDFETYVGSLQMLIEDKENRTKNKSAKAVLDSLRKQYPQKVTLTEVSLMRKQWNAYKFGYQNGYTVSSRKAKAAFADYKQAQKELTGIKVEAMKVKLESAKRDVAAAKDEGNKKVAEAKYQAVWDAITVAEKNKVKMEDAKKRYEDALQEQKQSKDEILQRQKYFKDKISNLIDDISDNKLFDGGTFDKSDVIRLARAVTNVVSDKSFSKLENVVKGLYEKTDYVKQVTQLDSWKKDIQNMMKAGTLTGNDLAVLKDLNSLNPSQVSDLATMYDIYKNIIDNRKDFNPAQRLSPQYTNDGIQNFVDNEREYDLQQRVSYSTERYADLLNSAAYQNLKALGLVDGFEDTTIKDIAAGIQSTPETIQNYREKVQELNKVEDAIRSAENAVDAAIQNENLDADNEGDILHLDEIIADAMSEEDKPESSSVRTALEEQAVSSQQVIDTSIPGLTAEQKSMLDMMKEVDVSGWDANTLRLFMNTIQNIYDTGDNIGFGIFQARYEAQVGEEMQKWGNLIFGEGYSVRNAKYNHQWIKQNASVDNFLSRLANNSKTLRNRFVGVTRFGRIRDNAAQATNEHHNILDKPLADLAREHKLKMDDVDIHARLSLYSWMMQNKNGSLKENNAELKRRVGEIVNDIQVKEKAGDSEKAEAATERKIFYEMVDKINSAKGIELITKNDNGVEVVNNEAIAQITTDDIKNAGLLSTGENAVYELYRNVYDKVRPQFTDKIRSFQNKELVLWNNYMKDTFRELNGNYIAGNFASPGESGYFASSNALNMTANSALDRVQGNRITALDDQLNKNNGEKVSRGINLNFFKNQSDNVNAMLMDVYTLEDRTIAEAVFNNGDFVASAGGIDNTSLAKEFMTRELKGLMGITSEKASDNAAFFNKIVRPFSQIAVKMQLADAGQYLKQASSQLVNTAVDLGLRGKAGYLISASSVRRSDQNVRTLISKSLITQRSDTRGGTNIYGDKNIADLKEKLENKSGVSKVRAKLLESIGKKDKYTGEEKQWATHFLSAGDTLGAEVSWVAYYADHLVSNGLYQNFDSIDWAAEAKSPNPDASAAAQDAVANLQNVNSNASASSFVRDKNATLARAAFGAFGSFAMNKFEVYNQSLRTLLTKDPSITNEEQRKEQVAEARRRFAASMVEDIFYGFVVKATFSLAKDALSDVIIGWLGADDEEKAKREKSKKKQKDFHDKLKQLGWSWFANTAFSWTTSAGQDLIQSKINDLLAVKGEDPIFFEPQGGSLPGVFGAATTNFYKDMQRIYQTQVGHREDATAQDRNFALITMLSNIAQASDMNFADVNRVIHKSAERYDKAILQDELGVDKNLNDKDKAAQKIGVGNNIKVELTEDQSKLYEDAKKEFIKNVPDEAKKHPNYKRNAAEYAKGKLMEKYGDDIISKIPEGSFDSDE